MAWFATLPEMLPRSGFIRFRYIVNASFAGIDTRRCLRDLEVRCTKAMCHNLVANEGGKVLIAHESLDLRPRYNK